MYQGKKISVAMATYNGEKYIREQLESICRQTIPPDEIIVSDDGSTDQTLNLVLEIAGSDLAAPGQITLLTDNPTRGFAYNFAHAIQHCTGDIVFLCDQDDIWLPEKVKHIADVYLKHPEALCVFHNASSIDANGALLAVAIDSFVNDLSLHCQAGEILQLPCEHYCAKAASTPCVNGMIMSVSALLLRSAFPFPPISSQHDGWLWFCAEAQDSCFYLNEILTQRRLHSSNTSGAGRQGFGLRRVKKIMNHIAKHNDVARARILFATHADKYIAAHCSPDYPGIPQATSAIRRTLEIGQAELAALKSSRLTGSVKLLRLFLKDKRYRKSGGKAFLYELGSILLHSKKERIKTLEALGL